MEVPFFKEGLANHLTWELGAEFRTPIRAIRTLNQRTTVSTPMWVSYRSYLLACPFGSHAYSVREDIKGKKASTWLEWLPVRQVNIDVISEPSVKWERQGEKRALNYWGNGRVWTGEIQDKGTLASLKRRQTVQFFSYAWGGDFMNKVNFD